MIVVATGDLIDYYHDGKYAWDLGKAHWSTSNFQALVDLITGQDGRGEPLICPIYLILGNHDFLQPEVPMSFSAHVYLIGLASVVGQDRYKAYLPDWNAAKEYDYWWDENPWDEMIEVVDGRERKLTANERARKIRQAIKGWHVRLDQKQAYNLTDPHYLHLGKYPECINYDTDFKFCIGLHQFICLNTGHDLVPTEAEIGWEGLGSAIGTGSNAYEDSDKDFVNDGPQNEGITDYHLELVEKALTDQAHDGLVFCFSHAPLVYLQGNRTDGIDVLFEGKHNVLGAAPNQATALLEDLWHESGSWPFNLLGISVNKEWMAAALKDHGYPQAGTHYFKRGKRDNMLNFNCAAGEYEKLSHLIAPYSTSTQPVSGKTRRRKLAALFSGHTHTVHEFRLEGPRNATDQAEGAL